MGKIASVFTFFVFIVFPVCSSFANDRLSCSSSGENKAPKALMIGITPTEISTTDGSLAHSKPHIWKRQNPGLFSFWGADSSEMQNSNEKTVWHVRFDIENKRALSSIPTGSSFTMEIAFIWESRYFDTSGTTSKAFYRCKKL